MKNHRPYCLFLFACLVFFGKASAHSELETPLPREIRMDSAQAYLDSLRANFGRNKVIPPEIELPCLIALSRYPEFRDTRIEFVRRKISATMMARPRTDFLFKSHDRMAFRILINSDSAKHPEILVDNFSFNAQIGVIGHELAHLLYYSQTATSRILRAGIRYGNLGFRESFEKATDSVAIMRGFGWQLYDFASSIQHSPEIPTAYKTYKRQVYLEPQEILGIMRRYFSQVETEVGGEG